MRYIVDTHILIWFSEDKKKLSPEVIEILENYENIIMVSSYTLHEIALKYRNGNLKISVSLQLFFEQIESEYNVKVIHPTKKHFTVFSELTTRNDHNDPFDQMIIAQAISDKIPVISADSKFPFYTRQGLKLIEN